MRNAEFGMRNHERSPPASIRSRGGPHHWCIIPHSEFRIPNYQRSASRRNRSITPRSFTRPAAARNSATASGFSPRNQSW
jgi:hypothetical protein